LELSIMIDLAAFGWTAEQDQQFRQLENLDPLWIPGRVRGHNRLYYLLFTAQGDMTATLAGRLRHHASGVQDLPVVGDFVAVRPAIGQETKAMVEALLPRNGAFSRADGDLTRASGAAAQQIIAANIDIVFIVSSADADFSARRLERLLAAAWASNATPALIITKIDLVEDPALLLAEVAAQTAGIAVFPVSNKTGAGIDAIRAAIGPGQTALLVGSSGVGKSSLTNQLLGLERQRVNAMNDQGRGQHTTTARDLFLLPTGGLLLDTPGVRVITPWFTDGLEATFTDIDDLALACKFHDCGHESEPGCAVRAALEDGTIAAARYQGYLKLRRELSIVDRKGDKRAEAAQKRAQRTRTKAKNRQQKINPD
jgi:ribosome biogenesis GTPase